MLIYFISFPAYGVHMYNKFMHVECMTMILPVKYKRTKTSIPGSLHDEWRQKKNLLKQSGEEIN